MWLGALKDTLDQACQNTVGKINRIRRLTPCRVYSAALKFRASARPRSER